MEVYSRFPVESAEALDFSVAPKSDSFPKSADFPVLDLSCKKETLQDHQIGSYSLSPVSLENHSLSPTSHEAHNNNQPKTSSEEERKSPVEERTYMVTPPSESESPSKKFPPIYPQLCSSPTDIAYRYPLILPVNESQTPSPLPPLSLSTSSENVSQIPSFSLTPTTPVPSNVSPKPDNSASDASKKAPRPFKAYPKDPLALTVGPAEFIYDPTSKEAYSEFRKRMLESVRKTNEGTNIKMRRVSKNSNLPTSTMDDKDAAYWERRRKNNEAAKRSRDARRAKEDEIAIRAAFLEQENMKLKYEIVALRNETARLRCLVYST
ncbi:protein giant [Chelonus insularis]|uniref:protein giant n=1 Tax=Chelonus insularis TaxID=460826 RepID=UPI00158CB533|nr:protein giant [Chelonus insularis]